MISCLIITLQPLRKNKSCFFTQHFFKLCWGKRTTLTQVRQICIKLLFKKKKKVEFTKFYGIHPLSKLFQISVNTWGRGEWHKARLQRTHALNCNLSCTDVQQRHAAALPPFSRNYVKCLSPAACLHNIGRKLILRALPSLASLDNICLTAFKVTGGMHENPSQLPMFLFFQRNLGYCRLLQTRSATYHKSAFKLFPNIPEYCHHPAVTRVLNIILGESHQALTEYIYTCFVLLFVLPQQAISRVSGFIYSFLALNS